MKGKILHIDAQTGDGVISAEDGLRYRFAEHDLKGAGQLALAGAAVDFETSGERAVDVYPDPGPAHVAGHLGAKKRLFAGLLAFFLGMFGIHKFYLGYNRAGLIMMAGTLLGWMLLWIPTGIVWLIAMVEAVIYLTRSDDQFFETYERGRKPWL